MKRMFGIQFDSETLFGVLIRVLFREKVNTDVAAVIMI